MAAVTLCLSAVGPPGDFADAAGENEPGLWPLCPIGDEEMQELGGVPRRGPMVEPNGAEPDLVAVGRAVALSKPAPEDLDVSTRSYDLGLTLVLATDEKAGLGQLLHYACV